MMEIDFEKIATNLLDMRFAFAVEAVTDDFIDTIAAVHNIISEHNGQEDPEGLRLERALTVNTSQDDSKGSRRQEEI